MPDLLAAIRLAMKDPTITQAELARRINRTQPALSRVLNGKRRPTFGLIQRIMAELGLEVRRSQKRVKQGATNDGTLSNTFTDTMGD